MADTMLNVVVGAAAIFGMWLLLTQLMVPPREWPKVRR
jgi:hypothetical protein